MTNDEGWHRSPGPRPKPLGAALIFLDKIDQILPFGSSIPSVVSEKA